MSRVFFSSARAKDFDYNFSMPAKLEESAQKEGRSAPMFAQSKDRIALKPKGHGWKREGENLHPCQGKKPE